MGEKNNEGKVVQKKEGGNGHLTVVLKCDFHCDGCVTKLVKEIRSFEGVEKVTGDADSKKLTVIGKVDPETLREIVDQKTKEPVELVSPILKKDGKGKDGGGGSGGGGEKKKQNNKKNDSKKENKGEDKKTKEKEVNSCDHCKWKDKVFSDNSLTEVRELVVALDANKIEMDNWKKEATELEAINQSLVIKVSTLEDKVTKMWMIIMVLLAFSVGVIIAPRMK